MNDIDEVRKELRMFLLTPLVGLLMWAVIIGLVKIIQ